MANALRQGWLPQCPFDGETPAASIVPWYRERSRSSRRAPECRGEVHQLGDRVHTELAHDLRAMRLHGALGGAQGGSHLLVQHAGHEQVEHLSLARGELVEAGLDRADLTTV